jgi:hypothetical protein
MTIVWIDLSVICNPESQRMLYPVMQQQTDAQHKAAWALQLQAGTFVPGPMLRLRRWLKKRV